MRDRQRLGRGPSKRLTPTWRLTLGVGLPIVVSVVSQLSILQNATCVVAELPWGVGRCDVMADLVAPAWALAIVAVARRLRLAVRRDIDTTPLQGTDPARMARHRLGIVATRLASIGAVVIIVLAYTREWERFNEQPDAVWYAVVIAVTLALLFVPVWVMKESLHARGVHYLDHGALPQRVYEFFLAATPRRPARWPHVLALSGVSLVVAFTVLGQLDALLQGMHLPADPSAGIGSLAGLDHLDLSEKLELTLDRVAAWRSYTIAVGAEFGSAYDVVVTHTLFDTLVTIPAYLAGGLALAFLAWSRRRSLEDPVVRRTFELVVLIGLIVLATTALLDVVKNLLTWYVTDRAWHAPLELTDATVRLLWFAGLARTIGLAVLAVAIVLLLALADIDTGRIRHALVAVRSELLLVGLFAFALLLTPQTADVIRGWRVSHGLIAVAAVTIWSMLLRWTSVSNLRLQHASWEAVQKGAVPAPQRVRFPWLSVEQDVGRLAVIGLIGLAAVQVVLESAGVAVGVGLLVPAGCVTALWLLGLALPPATFVRGDRPVPASLRRRLPRSIGAAVYLVIGIAVLKAAATSIAYARHEDWWLAMAVLPPLIGLWRVATRTTSSMGAIEALFAVGVATLGLVLVFRGDPELSPAALGFTGVTFAYGSLAFFNSYEPDALPSRISRDRLAARWAKPFVATASVSLVVAIAFFFVDPIVTGPRIGTVGILVMAMMVLTTLGAGAVRLAETTRPPRILAAFGIRRSPFVALALVWVLLAPGVVDEGITDVRTIPGTPPQAVGFDDVWDRWTAVNLADDGADRTSYRRVRPLVLISSSGGGLRAAAWTSFVLSCIFESQGSDADPCTGARPADLGPVALMSGVSGGSLGFAGFVAHVLDGVPGDTDWVDDAYDEDFLATSVGWLFFADLPRSLLGFVPTMAERAEMMDRSWEAAWPDGGPGVRRGLGALWNEAPHVPPLVFNGTSVNDGCRVNVSVLDVAGISPAVPTCASGGSADLSGVLGATHDLIDYLCPGEDVSLATAAGMSARFPFVSLAGRLAGRDCNSASGAVYVADGGYLEGSGAGTLLDGWFALAPSVEARNLAESRECVVPFMIHIDNGYESPSSAWNSAVPREALVPLRATMNVASGIVSARADAALAFQQPFAIGGESTQIRDVDTDATVSSRYVRLVTRAHPGVQAPLGWTLSQASIDDLRDQLAIPENRDALREVRQWLDGRLECVPGS